MLRKAGLKRSSFARFSAVDCSNPEFGIWSKEFEVGWLVKSLAQMLNGTWKGVSLLGLASVTLAKRGGNPTNSMNGHIDTVSCLQVGLCIQQSDTKWTLQEGCFQSKTTWQRKPEVQEPGLRYLLLSKKFSCQMGRSNLQWQKACHVRKSSNCACCNHRNRKWQGHVYSLSPRQLLHGILHEESF